MVQTYDAASRLIDRTTSSGTESYTYDANGNMIWLVADGKESAYTWNKENMFVNVVYKGNTETGFDFSLTGCLRREYWAAYSGGASTMARAEVKGKSR